MSRYQADAPAWHSELRFHVSENAGPNISDWMPRHDSSLTINGTPVSMMTERQLNEALPLMPTRLQRYAQEAWVAAGRGYQARQQRKRHVRKMSKQREKKPAPQPVPLRALDLGGDDE